MNITGEVIYLKNYLIFPKLDKRSFVVNIHFFNADVSKVKVNINKVWNFNRLIYKI